MKAYGFYCIESGFDSDVVIKSFFYTLEEELHWIKGYKYWRHKPTLESYIDYDSSAKREFKIYSRLFAVEERLDLSKEMYEGITEASLENAKEILKPQIEEITLRGLAGEGISYDNKI
jgi:hypothetical protein